jgi:transketolase
LHEALLAREILSEHNYSLKVVNMPWLNRVDPKWLSDTIGDGRHVFVLEDHASVGGFGDCLLKVLARNALLRERRFISYAIDEFPACGTPMESLTYHGLDGTSLSERIQSEIEDYSW